MHILAIQSHNYLKAMIERSIKRSCKPRTPLPNNFYTQLPALSRLESFFCQLADGKRFEIIMSNAENCPILQSLYCHGEAKKGGGGGGEKGKNFKRICAVFCARPNAGPSILIKQKQGRHGLKGFSHFFPLALVKL